LQQGDVDLLSAILQENIPAAPRRYPRKTNLEVERENEVERWEVFQDVVLSVPEFGA
jgi:hypothetical protein